MNRIVHFEIPAENLERAAKFYREVFGWQIDKWPGMEEDYWMVMTAEKGSKEPGINGGMMKRTGKSPVKGQGSNAFVCTIDVQNFDEAAKKIIKAGGRVSVSKYAIPKMAWLGYFTDTEGNTFGLFQDDKDAG